PLRAADRQAPVRGPEPRGGPPPHRDGRAAPTPAARPRPGPAGGHPAVPRARAGAALPRGRGLGRGPGALANGRPGPLPTDGFLGARGPLFHLPQVAPTSAGKWVRRSLTAPPSGRDQS